MEINHNWFHKTYLECLKVNCNRILSDFCSEHSGPLHPKIIPIEELRQIIPHTKGKHSPDNKGRYLCNGHCSWNKETCVKTAWVCINCYYIECWSCAEDFDNHIEELIEKWVNEGYIDEEDNWFGHGFTLYCRACGYHNTQFQAISKLEIDTLINALKRKEEIINYQTD